MEYLDKDNDMETGSKPVSQNYITTTFIYVNSDNSIDKVISETHPLTEMTLSYSQILRFIQTKKNTPTAKYKLMDILRYSVNLDASNIQHYASADTTSVEEMSKPFLMSMPNYESITFAPSIFAFHRVNSLYFIFKEKMRIPLKSILKSKTIHEIDSSSSPNKKTKKIDYKDRSHTKRVNFI